VRYNPCGRAVDVIRRSYTTLARPFRDSDQTVTILWYTAQKNAPDLGVPCMMVSEDWDPDGAVLPPGGEVPNEPRPFVNSREKPGALGEHVCGTAQDFSEGGHYDADSPPVVYGTLGLPNCCNPAVVASGGGASGGRAVVSFSNWTCETAREIEFGVTDDGGPLFTSMFPSAQFWKFDTTAGTTYKITFSDFPGVDWEFQIFHGDCSGPIPDDDVSFSAAPVVMNYTATDVHTEWVVARKIVFGDNQTFKVLVEIV
jgi:hypothetical protein